MMHKSIAKSVGMMPISENHDVEVFASEDGKKTSTKLRVPIGGGAFRVTSFNCPEAVIAFGEELVRMGRECSAVARPILDYLVEKNKATP